MLIDPNSSSSSRFIEWSRTVRSSRGLAAIQVSLPIGSVSTKPQVVVGMAAHQIDAARRAGPQFGRAWNRSQRPSGWPRGGPVASGTCFGKASSIASTFWAGISDCIRCEGPSTRPVPSGASSSAQARVASRTWSASRRAAPIASRCRRRN